MEASRTQSVAGEGIGVAAEVVNDSPAPITIRESSVTLTVPPEMTGAFSETRTWYAYFPTEHVPTDQATQYKELTLQPKSSYEVFWTPSEGRYQPPTATDSLLSLAGRAIHNVLEEFTSSLGYVFFTPGDYKITAQVKYWDLQSPANSTYRTAQKSTTIHLAAPQSVIMIGAILGGLIAYAILPQSRRQRLTITRTEYRTQINALVGRVFQQAYGILGACLLSVIVTILLARISETQFLVKVTINDVWGAITIGFVANYFGTRILDRLLPTEKSKTTIDETVPADKKRDLPDVTLNYADDVPEAIAEEPETEPDETA